LERLLADAGFSIIAPGTLAWEEQIAVFRGARIIVGPHGAGLANAVFSESGARVIELTNAHHYNRCFEWLCHIKEHEYVPISSDDGTYGTATQLAKAIVESIN
jgi:capsular polysaccharide biosynthesis protein